MFALNENEIAAIQTAWEASGELAAAVELRRLFPGIADLEKAKECARTIATWRQPVPSTPRKPKRSCKTSQSAAKGLEAASDRAGTVVPLGRRRKVSRPG